MYLPKIMTPREHMFSVAMERARDDKKQAIEQGLMCVAKLESLKIHPTVEFSLEAFWALPPLVPVSDSEEMELDMDGFMAMYDYNVYPMHPMEFPDVDWAPELS